MKKEETILPTYKMGRSYHQLAMACTMALKGEKVLFWTYTKEAKKRAKKIVNEIMKGAWPIGLKIQSAEEENYHDKT